MILSKSPIILLGLLFSTLPVLGQGDAATPSAQTVADAEKSFAQASVDHGIKDSFLQFFSEDGIIFNPAPTNAKKFYANYDAKGRQLNWEPIFATISNAGDMGFTTGPWTMNKSAEEKTPIAFGNFISVWKKQKDNSWKVAVDLGVSHSQPVEPPEEIQLVPPNDALKKMDVDLARRNLGKAETTLAATLKEGAGSGIVASASDDVRVFRDESFPGVGKVAAKLMLSSDNGKMTRTKTGSGMSASGDLAYRYGSYSSERGNIKETGYFVSLWKLGSDREWRLLIDVQKKVEPKK